MSEVRELGVGILFADVVAPEQGEGCASLCLHGGVAGSGSGAEVRLSRGEEGGLHPAEVAARAEHGEEVLGLSLEEEDEGGDDVEHAPGEEHAPQLGVGEVLIEHEEVVAEVEVRLAGAAGGQRGSSDVGQSILSRTALCRLWCSNRLRC